MQTSVHMYFWDLLSSIAWTAVHNDTHTHCGSMSLGIVPFEVYATLVWVIVNIELSFNYQTDEKSLNKNWHLQATNKVDKTISKTEANRRQTI